MSTNPSRHTDSRYYRLYRNTPLISAVFVLLLIVAGFGLAGISFDHNIKTMLPDDPTIRRPLQFLEESTFSSNLLVSLSIPPEYMLPELLKWVDILADDLSSPALSPYISNIITGLPDTGVSQSMADFLNYAPQLISPGDLAAVEARINPAGIKKTLEQIYLKMMTPAGSFMLPFFQNDPLSVKTPLLDKLNILSKSMGYQVKLENGHFVSRDGRHALMILTTPVSVTDPKTSRKLLDVLNKSLNRLPGHISADIIGGHLHTLSNETIIKRDIRLTLTIAAMGFLLLFGLVFRDVRAVLVFLLPSLFILIALGLLALVYDALSYFVLGMSVVIAGIAIDYGIHTYLAVKTGRDTANVTHIIRPLIYGAATTITIFASFYLLSVKGYHELATFSICALLLCLGGAIFLLPRFLKPGQSGVTVNAQRHLSTPARYVILGLWGLFLVTALAVTPRISLQTDFAALDGTAPEILAAENRFRETWTTRQQDPAVLVISAATEEKALSLNETVYQQATTESDAVEASTLASIAPIWPSQATRKKNLNNWNRFWTTNGPRLQELLVEQGKDFHFSKAAFSPFFNGLTIGRVNDIAPRDISLLVQLKDRFILNTDTGVRILTFFPDTPDVLKKMEAVSGTIPEAFIVAQNAFAQRLSKAIAGEIQKLAIIAAILIPLLTLLLLRRVQSAALAMVPVLSWVRHWSILMPRSPPGLVQSPALRCFANIFCTRFCGLGMFFLILSKVKTQNFASLYILIQTQYAGN